MRVAVVGAGFAGLAAAEALQQAGAEAVVLEARARVGGRVRSRRLPNGAVVELGAEFVLDGNDTIRSYAERFALGWWDKGMRYGVREPRGGLDSTATARDEALGLVSAALERGEGEGVSAAAFLDRLDLDPGARDGIRARLEVSCAADGSRVAATELVGLAAHSHAPSPSVAGGNDRVGRALAAELGDAVRLGEPVRRIAWRASGATVVTDREDLEADRVVLALPASVIGSVAFAPALPASLAAAYEAVEYGHAAKLFVPLASPAPPSAVLSVPGRWWCWTATGAEDVQPVVSCFAGSVAALERLDVAAGPGAWLEALAELRPDLDLDPAGAVLSTWDDDPWVRAAYSSAAPPEAAWAPAGPFHVCGEHTAGDRAALMDGALASGLRVAAEIAPALRSGRNPDRTVRIPSEEARP